MITEEIYNLYLQHPEISTDTRNIREGCLFFALQGDHFDGNDFAAEALDKGAAYALVSDLSIASPKAIYVENTLLALQQLARHHRQQLTIPVIAITGSNGKTTTKELVHLALSARYTTTATSGNLNNHIGVPLTLLRIPKQTEIAIVEMGANHVGEIASLCTIANPTHGLITNIGKAHLEGFGSLAGVKQAKGELLEHLRDHGGFAFVNLDDPHLREMSATLPAKTTYGLDMMKRPDIHFELHEKNGHPGFVLSNDQVAIHTSLFGKYNAYNVLAAFTVGDHFNIDHALLAETLSAFQSTSNRSEVIKIAESIIVKDAYNANPSSMESALKAFAQTYPNGVVVLGDMKELGKESTEAHKMILDLALSLPVSKIIAVGIEFGKALNSLTEDRQHNVTIFENVSLLNAAWSWNEMQGKAILLKGSRSMQLEKLLLSIP